MQNPILHEPQPNYYSSDAFYFASNQRQYVSLTPNQHQPPAASSTANQHQPLPAEQEYKVVSYMYHCTERGAGHVLKNRSTAVSYRMCRTKCA